MSVIAPFSLRSISTMSKDNMLLGYARGKVGSLVFARRAGVQITRAYNANPANPRTSGQMGQRMLMATAIQAYRFLSAICDHSFENAVGKNGNMRSFMSAALRDLKSSPANFAFQRYGERNLLPGPYQVSAGSLSSVPAPSVRTTVNTADLVAFSGSSAQVSLKDIANAMGLYKVGDMVTLLVIYPNVLTGAGFGFVRCKLVAEPTGTITAPAQIPSSVIEIESPNGVTVNDHLSYYADTTQEGQYIASLTINAMPAWLPATGADYFHTAAIRSRYEDGKWLRSESFIAVGEGYVPAPTYDDALATYPQTTDPVLNGGQV